MNGIFPSTFRKEPVSLGIQTIMYCGSVRRMVHVRYAAWGLSNQCGRCEIKSSSCFASSPTFGKILQQPRVWSEGYSALSPVFFPHDTPSYTWPVLVCGGKLHQVKGVTICQRHQKYRRSGSIRRETVQKEDGTGRLRSANFNFSPKSRKFSNQQYKTSSKR